MFIIQNYNWSIQNTQWKHLCSSSIVFWFNTGGFGRQHSAQLSLVV